MSMLELMRKAAELQRDGKHLEAARLYTLLAVMELASHDFLGAAVHLQAALESTEQLKDLMVENMIASGDFE